MRYYPVAGPHTHGGESSSKLMYQVVLALLPTIVFGLMLFGLSALKVLAISIISALVSEWLCLRLMQRKTHSVFDGSALLTAILLALSLPASTPWWVVMLGSSFAIAIGKQVYGGLGQNLFNPAMLARVFLLICFPLELTQWQSISMPEIIDGRIILSQQWLAMDAMTSATPLADPSLNAWQLMTGQHAGSWGETSSLLILLGGIYLIARRVIRYVVPVAVLLGIAVPAFVAHLWAPENFISLSSHLFSGASFFVAFFIATDMVTSPASAKGQWVYGLSIGLLMWTIRSFGNYPEGAAFAVLILNAATPLIDHYLRPAIFGSDIRLTQKEG